MDLIEQAAKRLEELRRAGAEIEEAQSAAAAPVQRAAAKAEPIPTPEAAMRNVESRAANVVAAKSPDVGEQDRIVRRAAVAPVPARLTQPLLEIDLDQLKTQGMVTPDAPRSQVADEFRVLKRPIVGNALGRSGTPVSNGNLVMVTSALPGEGKTFTAINLAMSIAMELDTTVLLVDGDVAHPAFPSRLGAANSPGLLDLLTQDNLEVGDVIVRTNIKNLSIIPAGTHHRRATELLASVQMAMLLRELSSRYPDRIIIFDSPPLLATTESRVLATHMGQIVMVVAADSTRQQAVNLALSTIDTCNVVLMVLNKAGKTDVGTYYGYYGDDAKSP